MTVTVAYYVLRGLRPALVFEAAVAAVVLDHGELEFIGMELVSDTTSALDVPADMAGIPSVTRTLVVQPTAARAGDFPDGSSQIAAMRDLYTNVLAAALPAQVQAAEPVYAA